MRPARRGADAADPPTGTPIAELTATAAATQAAPTPADATPLPAVTPTLTPIAETSAAATPTPIDPTPASPSALTYAQGTIFDDAWLAAARPRARR